jgi:integrase
MQEALENQRSRAFLLSHDDGDGLFRGALVPWKPEHYAIITEPRGVGQLLRDIEAYEGGLMTRCALRLAPLFVRPRELRQAEWKEIDLDLGEWRIRARKMKARRMHIVPLSSQAVTTLRELQPLTGSGTWVFPRLRSNGEPMSENTLNAALRRMGYERSKMTAHGFGAWPRPCSTRPDSRPRSSNCA